MSVGWSVVEHAGCWDVFLSSWCFGEMKTFPHNVYKWQHMYWLCIGATIGGLWHFLCNLIFSFTFKNGLDAFSPSWFDCVTDNCIPEDIYKNQRSGHVVAIVITLCLLGDRRISWHLSKCGGGLTLGRRHSCNNHSPVQRNYTAAITVIPGPLHPPIT